MRRLYHLAMRQLALTMAKAHHRSRVQVGARVVMYGRPVIRAVRGSRVVIGEGASLASRSTRTPLGVNHAVVIRTLLPGAEIVIGPGTGISGGSICSATSVHIGASCLLGANVTVVDTDFHPVHSRTRVTDPVPTPAALDRVRIGDNVFIGTGSTILKGVTIGDDCVVGAGSVVTRDCEPGTIVAGNPARPVGRVDVDPARDDPRQVAAT